MQSGAQRVTIIGEMPNGSSTIWYRNGDVRGLVWDQHIIGEQLAILREQRFAAQRNQAMAEAKAEAAPEKPISTRSG